MASLVKDFENASIGLKGLLITLIIASFCVSIAFTCTGWGAQDDYSGGAVTTKIRWGLWKRCEKADTVMACSDLSGTPNDWWAFSQVGSWFGFVGTLLSLGLVALHIFFEKCQKNRDILIVAGIISVATGTLFLIACIVFGAKWNRHYKSVPDVSEYYLSYAFGFAIVASILEITVGVLCFVEAKKGTPTKAAG